MFFCIFAVEGVPAPHTPKTVMAEQLAAGLTEPLRNLHRRHVNPDSPDLARMSRRRFFCFQTVTLLTALITCFTLLAVTLLKNEELQNKLLNFGQTASCLLNATTLLPPKEKEGEDVGWNDFLSLLLKMSSTCAADAEKPKN